jgi:hypothetical protein
VGFVKLTGDQPAVVPPFGKTIDRGAAHTRQRLGQPGHIVQFKQRGASRSVVAQRPVRAYVPGRRPGPFWIKKLFTLAG